MRFCVINWGGTPRVGLYTGAGVKILRSPFTCVGDFVRARAKGNFSLETISEEIRVKEEDFLLPLSNFTREIFCTGWNYFEHFEEGVDVSSRRVGQKMPEHPTFFTKTATTVVGPTESLILRRDLSQQWDFEAEIAVLIGKGGSDIKEADALDHVFGYFLANDISARDVQKKHGGQWFKGKSFDRTMPIGSLIVTPDELEYDTLTFTCTLNGIKMQKGWTTDMAFSVARLIEELSVGLALIPGDLILTGTPAGVGFARQPPVYLQDGDVIEINASQDLGILRNTIASA